MNYIISLFFKFKIKKLFHLMILKLSENDTFDLSKIEFEQPIKDKDHYFIKPSNSLLIQLDNVFYNKEDSKLVLCEREIDFFNNFDDICLKYVNLNSEVWFNKTFTNTKLKKTWENSINENKLNTILSNDFLIFNSQNLQITNCSFDKNISVILEFSGIKFFSKKIHLLWSIKQFQIETPKSLFI